MQRGATLDVEVGENGTALHLAARKKNYDILDLLLREGDGADSNIRDSKGRTPLLAVLEAEAVEHDPVNEAIVKRLLDAGAGADEGNEDNTNAPLHAALRSINPRIISTILDPRFEANVDLTVQGWQTPLGVAVELGQPRSVELLLGRGANPDAKCHRIETAGICNVLHLATESGHDEVVKLLLASQG